MTTAERLAHNASIPLEIATLVVREADRLGIGIRTLRGEGRHKVYASKRRSIARTARRDGWSLPLIGKALNRDHSTILHHTRDIASPRAPLSAGNDYFGDDKCGRGGRPTNPPPHSVETQDSPPWSGQWSLPL